MRAHEVDSGKLLISGIDSTQVLARDAHKLGSAGAGAYEHGVETLVEQVLDAQSPAHDHVGYELDTQRLDIIHLAVEDCPGKPELGDAVAQDSTGLVQSFEDRYRVSDFSQVTITVRPAGPLPTTAA